MKKKYVVIGVIFLIIISIFMINKRKDRTELDKIRERQFKNQPQIIQSIREETLQEPQKTNPNIALANAISYGIINGLNNLGKSEFNNFDKNFDNTLSNAIKKGIKEGLNGCHLRISKIGSSETIDITCF